MTLTNRVSLFFLATLAIVLVVYSLLLYFGARSYLLHQLDDDLLAAFHTLVAAAEVEQDDAKWEPSDHTIDSRTGLGREHILWLVRDEQGKWIDQSPGLAGGVERTAAASEAGGANAGWIPQGAAVSEDWLAPREVQGYRVVQRTLRAPLPKPLAERGPVDHDALTISVAVSAADTQASLGWLALLLTLASTGAWILAATVGRFFCRRALRPVESMARDAQQLTAADQVKRLAVPASGDELEELGGAFNGLLDRLHLALEHEQQFAGDAAHQLRTPLTVLLGQIEVARRRPRSTAEYQQLLEVLQGQTEELRELIESLLFLARPGDQAKHLERECVDLAQWVPNHLGRWSGRPRGGDVDFQSRTAELRVDTLSVLLGQAIDNLIDNALKYSEPGEKVNVVLDADGSHVLLCVEDHGAGIGEEDLPHLFEPFYRSATSRMQVPGSGRGLPVVKRIATTLGGEVRVESRLGQGSRFTLRLPIHSTRDAEAAQDDVGAKKKLPRAGQEPVGAGW